MTLKIYNVMSRTKEEFQPIVPGEVKMYACGITVSADAHIGHAYQSVAFDVITKYLHYKGFKVKYVRNYTDVDDKIIANANAAGVDALAFAEKNIIKTDDEVARLGNSQPTITARATQCIKDIIAFVQKLIDNGHAYESGFGDVYFKLDSFSEYGKLSHIKTNKNEIGVRKSVEPGKLNDGDFALWKAAKPGEISWDSPWGKGRPGWHIECSAMNLKYLGEQIDIHGGGRDLVFPHHENEIAQTESLTGKTFANYWVHCGLVKVNGQKMSKSLGNGILLKDVLNKYDSDVIRFALLRNIYSTDIDITDTFFPDARKHVYKVYSIIKATNERKYVACSDEKTSAMIKRITTEFETAMDDNFNTSAVIAAMFSWIGFISSELSKKQTEYNLTLIVAKIVELFKVFNIFQGSPDDYIWNVKKQVLNEQGLTEQTILDAIEKRTLAKSQKNWEMADSIREELLQKGIVLKDSPAGTVWDVDLR